MRNSIAQFVYSVALAGGCLFVASSPCAAQSIPLVSGGVQFEQPGPGQLGLALTVVERPDGTVQGRGTLTLFADRGLVRFDVTSYTFLGNTLCMAGSVTGFRNAVLVSHPR